jgi:hypothetical protein
MADENIPDTLCREIIPLTGKQCCNRQSVINARNITPRAETLAGSQWIRVSAGDRHTPGKTH